MSDEVRHEDEKLVTFSVQFAKTNFEKMVADLYYYSPPNVVRGLIWRIMIKKKFDKNDEKTWLEYYLQCKPVSDKVEHTWSCSVPKMKFIMLNKDNSKNVQKNCSRVFYSNESGWGYPNFYDWNKVCDYENNFINDDEDVKFIIDVTAHYPMNASIEEIENENLIKLTIAKVENCMTEKMDLMIKSLQTEMNLLNANLLKEFTILQLKFDELKSHCSIDTKKESKDDENVADTNDKKLGESVLTISKNVVENENKSCASKETVKQNIVDDLEKENASNENENTSVKTTEHVTPPDTSLNLEHSHHFVPQLYCGLKRATFSGTKSPYIPYSCYESRQMLGAFPCGFRPSCHEILPCINYQRCQCQFSSSANCAEEKPVNSESK